MFRFLMNKILVVVLVMIGLPAHGVDISVTYEPEISIGKLVY